eukprot:Skav216777  [mRNA]  locus=scaffold579:79004:79249:- [translate_table: standard]
MKHFEPEVKAKARPKSSRASSSSSQSVTSQEVVNAMKMMVETMQEIKQELADLQPERPRKKTEIKDDQASQESFQMVNRKG